MPGATIFGWLAAAGLTAVLSFQPVTAQDDACAEPDVALVLGSGGAAGLAHIAMLRVLEEHDIRPRAIAGTSIGAIIGALYAAGMPVDEIEALFREFGDSALNPFAGLFSGEGPPSLRDLIEIDLGNGSLLDSNRFVEFAGERMDAQSFSDLELPMSIVATDFWSGEQRIFNSGELLPVMRASMAVPGVFAPVERGEDLLIDGGASNPLPVDLVAEHDLVVAIDVTGSRNRDSGESPGITDFLFSSFEIMQQSILRANLRQHPADIYIKPELTGIRMLHFDRFDEVLEQSQAAAEELSRKLQEALAERCPQPDEP